MQKLHLKIVHYFLHARQINVFIDEANHIYITMPIYNLIGYIDSSGSSGCLRKFKRDEVPNNNADLTANNSQSFKYKAALWGKQKTLLIIQIALQKNTKIVVPLKYLINFWKLLEMPLISWKVHLELIWIECCRPSKI